MLKLDLVLPESKCTIGSITGSTVQSLKDNQKIRLLNEGEIKAGDELFAIDIYEDIKECNVEIQVGI